MLSRAFRVKTAQQTLIKVAVQRGEHHVTVVLEGNRPMAYKIFPAIFLIGWVVAIGVINGDALALRIGERSTDQIGKGLMVQQSLLFPSAQRGIHLIDIMASTPCGRP